MVVLTFKIDQDKMLYVIEEGGSLYVPNTALKNLIIELLCCTIIYQSDFLQSITRRDAAYFRSRGMH